MTNAVGEARALKTVEGDRRKQILQRVAATYVLAGDSVAASEVKARATNSYASDLDSINDDLRSAEKTIAAYDAEWASYNATRALIAAVAVAKPV
jgi:hypothetical protein